MSIPKEEFLVKNEHVPVEFIEVSCEIEIEYNDENYPMATKSDELHSLGLSLMQPKESPSECDESESERHYIRFDDEEDTFDSSESDNDNALETVNEQVDPVEKGMMLIFEDKYEKCVETKDVTKESKAEKKLKLQRKVVLPNKEVPVVVKEEIVDLNGKRSIRGRPSKVDTTSTASVKDNKSRPIIGPVGSRPSSSKWQLGPHDSFATIKNIASSENTEPVIVVVRNMDSDKPIWEPLNLPSSRKLKAKPMIKILKLEKTKNKKLNKSTRIARESKVVPAPVSVFPRICLKDTVPLQCVLCHMECSNRKALIEHVKSHSTDKKSFECPTCKKTFTQQCNLKRHMRCHSGERPFSCPYCKKLFADQGYLTTHLRYHTNTKPYTCQHCDKSFFDRSNYVKHLKSHSGEKPYPCPICKKSFLQQSDLTRHTRVHSGERPFKCSYCERSFTQHGDLTTHLRHHTGERPFVCSDCQKTFANKRYLNSHVKGRICLKRKGTVGAGSGSRKEIKLLPAQAVPVTKRLMTKKRLKILK